MKKIAYNPYLPGYEYVPDGEPHVFGDRVYIFGSHDSAGGTKYCQEDYVCWSAPVNELYDWNYEGIIYRKEQDPENTDGTHVLFAPDVVQGPDGRYYLYYGLDFLNYISVAVCDTPAGKYEYYGTMQYHNKERMDAAAPFDPAVFRDDDGRIWLYYGFCPTFKISTRTVPDSDGAVCVELEPDMITCKGIPTLVVPNKANEAGTGYEGHAFFEAPSVRKIDGTYYFVYASSLIHELCYATSSKPDSGFVYGGTIISGGDIGYQGITENCARNATSNIHGGLIQLEGQWYIFYHRHTNGTQFSRQGCAEPVAILLDGSIMQVEMTSCGLNGGIMPAKGMIPAYCACNMYKGKGGKPIAFGPPNVEGPYVTENHKQYPETERLPYVTNITDTSVVGFRYLVFDGTEKTIAVSIRGNGTGEIIALIDDDGQQVIGKIAVAVVTDEWKTITATVSATEGRYPLSFLYLGEGKIDLNYYSFT